MLSRWSVLLTRIGVVAGSLAAAAGAAAPASARAARPVPPASLLRPGLLVGPAGSGAAPRTGGPRLQGGTSRNWSGYAITGGRYNSVTASWVQPQVSCPGGNQYSTFWVGLNGFGGNNAVEQTGGEADCANGSPRYYAWYELYPAYPVDFSDPLQPGDHLTGSVTAGGGGRYTLVISDTTQGWSHRVTGTGGRAASDSAEVIAEAPSVGKRILPLANFGQVTFTGAAVNGSPLGSYGPTEITMAGSAGRYKDLVSPLTGGNFSVAWQRNG